MNSLSQSFPAQREQIHEQMFKLHGDIRDKALKRVADALAVLHRLEIEQLGVRELCRGYIVDFEKLRSSLEHVMREAADLRTRLIHENGCDGTCYGT